MYNFTFSRWQTLPAEPLSIIARSGMKYTNNKNNISEILKVYIINSITKSYILNIKIRTLVTEYALTIKLVGVPPTRLTLIQPTISLEMPVPSRGHYGFHSFPVVD
jgi:hypothetical protein